GGVLPDARSDRALSDRDLPHGGAPFGCTGRPGGARTRPNAASRVPPQDRLLANELTVLPRRGRTERAKHFPDFSRGRTTPRGAGGPGLRRAHAHGRPAAGRDAVAQGAVGGVRRRRAGPGEAGRAVRRVHLDPGAVSAQEEQTPAKVRSRITRTCRAAPARP